MSKLYVDELHPKTTSGNITAPSLVLPVGSVVQTLFAQTTTETSITGTAKGSGTSTGLSITITPKSVTNKFLINCRCSFMLATHANPSVSIEIHDGTSIVATDENSAVYINGDGNEHSNRWLYPFIAFVTPSSAGAITYTVRAWKSGNAVTAQPSSQPATMYIQEIQQ